MAMGPRVPGSSSKPHSLGSGVWGLVAILGRLPTS